MKVLLDMNLSPRWASFLRDAGFDADHWSELGEATAPDDEIMAYAGRNSYVILTHDLDFSAMLAAMRLESPSVVQIRSTELNPDVIGQRVVAALKQADRELRAGALLTLDLQRTRLRILPFR